MKGIKSITIGVALVVMLMGYLIACDPNGFAIWGNGGGDPPEPIVTCNEYHELTNMKWGTWNVWLEGTSGNYVYIYKPAETLYQIDIDSFILANYGLSQIYYNGVYVTGFIDGWDQKTYTLTHNLYLTDTIGGFNLIYFQPYVFSTIGAMPFQTFFSSLEDHSNFKTLVFWNTNFTCDEYTTILNWIIENCIDGTGNKIDLRMLPISCLPVDPEIITALEAADFTVIQ